MIRFLPVSITALPREDNYTITDFTSFTNLVFSNVILHRRFPNPWLEKALDVHSMREREVPIYIHVVELPKMTFA